MFLNELKGAILFLVQYVLFLDELTFSPRLFLEALGLFLVDSIYSDSNAFIFRWI
jgi:hypothetical protein